LPDDLEAPVELIDHRGVDWRRVRRIAYLVHQILRYEYPGQIEDLRQRLVVFPPDLHGSQRLIGRHLQVSIARPGLREEFDRFGNRVCHLFIPHVERTIEFELRFLVERKTRFVGDLVDEMSDPAYLQPSALTHPDAQLERIAAQLAAADEPISLAERINAWAWRALTYTHGVTDVKTTAAQALALARGVCQDYAHLMLAICRQIGLPARYVSGHLLGEGGTHAWVEVLAPDSNRPSRLTVQAVDPLHG